MCLFSAINSMIYSLSIKILMVSHLKALKTRLSADAKLEQSRFNVMRIFYSYKTVSARGERQPPDR